MEKEHKKEHRHEHPKEEVHETQKQGFKLPNLWMITTLMLVIALIAVIAMRGMPASATGMSASECGQKTISYLNANLVQPGTQATLESVKDESGVYAIITDYLNRSITVYTTKDCELLFLSSLNTSEELPTVDDTTQEASAIPKSDKPEVDLYVMAFCPYGVQAEQAMIPVQALLGTKADFSIRFIANVNGNNVTDVDSLHGIEEAKEDLRQLCVMKYYPSKYWSYVTDIDNNCYPVYRDSAAMDLCWKNASIKLGINVSQIEKCAYGPEGITLLQSDEALTQQYQISGSPTLLINGQRYSGARTPEAFKTAICDAFNTAPSECSQALSEDGGAATGGCQ